MLRRDVHGRFAASLRHLPSALAQHPLDEGGDRPRHRLFDGRCADVSPLVGLGDGQRHDRRLTGQRRTIGRERDVGRLERQRVAGHDRTERVVHARLDFGDAAEAGVEVHEPGAERGQPVAHLAVDADVRAAEAVDRLLRVADEKQRAGPWTRAPPVGLAVVVGREQQEDLRLERIGVLELVDEDPLEARLESAPHLRVVAHEVARAEQQIEEVERPASRLQLVVAVDGAAEVALEQGGEVGIGGQPELIETRLERHTGLKHAVARDAVRIGGPTSRLRVGERPILREIDERRLPPVVVPAASSSPEVRWRVISSLSRRAGSVPGVQRVVLRGRLTRERRELVQLAR